VISAGKREAVSLLDAAKHHSVDCWVVFKTMVRERHWLWRLLKPGFYHVEVWGYVPPGAWIRFDTAAELIYVEVYADPPWVLTLPSETPTFLHYQALVPLGRIRQPWRMGPVTCVELTAAFLGVRLPFLVRTPYQLYKFLTKDARDGSKSTEASH